MDSSSAPAPASPLRLLSLDGGGIRGLSALLILKGIMHQLDAYADLSIPRPLRPADFFDLIAGTSTGGLIAIMLGRIGMGIDECIHTYLELAPKIFPEEKLLARSKAGKFFKGMLGRSRFSADTFKEELRQLLLAQGFDVDAAFETRDDSDTHQTKVFVCATARATTRDVRLRSYYSSWEYGTGCKIWEAAQATSAAPTFFDPITFGTPPIEYLDGGIAQSNNPINALWDEAGSIWRTDSRNRRRVGCIVSLGAGIPSLEGLGKRGLSILEGLANAARDCEQRAREFKERLDHEPETSRPAYFRFNVEQGLQNIGLEEWNHNGRLTAATNDYLRTKRKEVEACASLLANPAARFQSMGSSQKGPARTLSTAGSSRLSHHPQFNSAHEARPDPPPYLDLDPSTADQADVAIIVMGLTGSGKSTFINRLTNEQVLIGHTLTSCTAEARLYLSRRSDKRHIWLLDTPGFDDTYRSDADVLSTIVSAIIATGMARKIAGIIYLHPITDVRMTGSAQRYITLLKALCGESAYPYVTLATTMWDHVSQRDGTLVQRESQLKREWWADFHAGGGKALRHHGSRESARKIVDHVVATWARRGPFELRVFTEMVRENIPLDKTAAGREVDKGLERLRQECKMREAALEEGYNTALRERADQHAIEMRQQRKELEAERAQAKQERAKLRVDLDRLLQAKDDEYQGLVSQLDAERQESARQLAKIEREIETIKQERQADQESVRNKMQAWQEQGREFREQASIERRNAANNAAERMLRAQAIRDQGRQQQEDHLLVQWDLLQKNCSYQEAAWRGVVNVQISIAVCFSGSDGTNIMIES